MEENSNLKEWPNAEGMKTASMIDKEEARNYAETHDVTILDLLEPDTARAVTSEIMENIVAKKAAANARYKVNGKGTKLRNGIEIAPSSIMVELLKQTDDIRITRREKDADACEYAIRHYDEKGEPTGLWDEFELRPGRIGAQMNRILTNIYGDCTNNHRRDIVGAMCADFCSSIPDGSKDLGDFDYMVIPCNNGIVDRRGVEPGARPNLTPWSDIDAIKDKYGDHVFTWKLAIDYKADAQCPSDLDPIEFIKSLFDVNTEVGQASIRVWIQSNQFAIRGTSGEFGDIIYLINSDATCNGQNGKTTACNMLKFLFAEQPERDETINTTPMDITFSGRFGKEKLLNEKIHIGDEMSGSIERNADYKDYTRNNPVTIEIKNQGMRTVTNHCGKFQSMNEVPNMAGHKDGATYEHAMFIKFEKDFRVGSPDRDESMERGYTSRQDVLEYYLKILCEKDFPANYDEDDRRILRQNVEEVKDANDNARIAIREMLDELDGVTTIPIKVLFDLYDTGWVKENEVKPLNAKHFKKEVIQFCADHPDKFCYDDNRRTLHVNELEGYAETVSTPDGDFVLEGKEFEILSRLAKYDIQRCESFAQYDTIYNMGRVECKPTGLFNMTEMKTKTWNTGFVVIK